MRIICPSLEEFISVIAGLVERGLGFRADAGSLVIDLTGAH